MISINIIKCQGLCQSCDELLYLEIFELKY